ncbi:CbxX/CfqX [Ophiocordyceps sinensis CO18]|uniref:CbxX/CfqX n=1 Tax=Ophiocordyceps sinensis (strain Co18 / CGMCC 3.14243) TaxID=911162 RepID=T5A887_OPHSC|nr:CbxX/CfqX [Ophiocordyceps sinensis CO18]
MEAAPQFAMQSFRAANTPALVGVIGSKTTPRFLAPTRSRERVTGATTHADTLRRAKRDLDLERKRQTSQDEYRLELQRVEDEIHLHQRKRKYEAEEDEQGKTLSHKRALLRSLKETSERISAAKEKCSHQVPAVESAAVDENQVDESASPANQEWKDMKVQEGTCNHALDDLMELIGLDSVKDEFLAVKSSIDTKIRQGVSLTEERFSCALLGNPGTGKTTVARLWGRFLTSVGAVPGEVFQETTGAKLANDGVSAAEKMLEEIKDNGGGVLFIDEAYQLSSGNSPGGKAVMDYLLAEVENLRGKVIFVLAGYRKQMESFFAHNPGLPSRFPSKMVFEDYDDAQLLKIFQRQIKRKWGGRVVVEGEVDGLFPRIAARRVGRGRGTEGFGNARAVENALAKIEKRQARRLRLERRAGRSPNDTFTKEDIIGPEPAATLERCGAWKRLNDMVGLGKVKEEVKILLDSLTTNYQRELAEEPLIQFALNRVFLGSPGTGKTTVAKLYGQVLADLGLLSDGEVVVKTPADFVGAALGQSEAQTKGILAATVGKVLVIDEAYGLYGGRDGPGSVTDPYRVAVVDTIVAEVQGVPGEDRCVILLGYQEQMQNMFQHVNPGLSRRFAIDSPFVFEDFNDEELGRILDLKLKDSGFNTTGQGRRVAVEVLGRERSRPNFGNGGAVDNLLSKAKASFQKRSSHGNARRNMLEPADFDEEYNRAERTDTNVAMLFKGEVGRDKVVAFLEELQKRVKQLRSIDLDPKEEIPFNFLFRGPPGTGKTTTARKMGKVYYDMGILAEAKVIECSATDLIGQYTGQTGPKAYRLAEGHFAKEAVDELVDSMTKSKYQGKMIIILAGYVDDINRLLSTNPGMSSRFPEAIDFDTLEAQDCVKLLTSLLSQKKADLQQKGRDLDMACLEAPSDAFKADIVNRFQALARVKGWGNARDVKQLARCAFRRIDLMSSAIRLEEEHVRTELDKMLNDRMARQGATTASAPAMDEEHVRAELDKMLNDRMARQGATTASAPAMDAAPEEGTKKGTDAQDTCPHRPVRDGGVSDQVWHQLQLDRAEAGRKEARYQKLKMAQKSATDAARERIIGELLEEDERRKQEAAVKARLKAVGVCPAGYEWIKQEGGYRCAGGSHWMSDGDLKKMK